VRVASASVGSFPSPRVPKKDPPPGIRLVRAAASKDAMPPPTTEYCYVPRKANGRTNTTTTNESHQSFGRSAHHKRSNCSAYINVSTAFRAAQAMARPRPEFFLSPTAHEWCGGKSPQPPPRKQIFVPGVRTAPLEVGRSATIVGARLSGNVVVARTSKAAAAAFQSTDRQTGSPPRRFPLLPSWHCLSDAAGQQRPMRQRDVILYRRGRGPA
jgi:hypothetical protein